MTSTPATPRRLADASFVVPRLATTRLLLREPRTSDFERFATNAADAVAREHIGGPLDRREAWRRFTSMTGNWVVQGLGWWVVEEAALGAIGAVGVFRRETGPELEIGWSIDRPHWGHGYAPEAAAAALAFASEQSGGERIIAYVGVANAASGAVATKIGMQREREVEFYGQQHWLYGYPR